MKPSKMIKIIPAIDLIEGKCVRLTQGDYTQKKVYNENPLEVAKEFEAVGIEKLHLVDLDGAKAQHIVNWKVLEEITQHTNLKVDFGGGVKTDEDVKLAFDCGATQITAGSIAVKAPEKVAQWIIDFGAERIILGADVQDEKIAINGWKETTEWSLFDFLTSYQEQQVEYVICTDIAKDGMLAGSSIALYQKIIQQFPDFKLIASGGVSSIEEIQQLNEIGVYGAIIGKALYEGKINLQELMQQNF